jgi:hypothetical protein
MADRKQFESVPAPDQGLVHLLYETREQPITQDELREQRISFAYGNAPTDATTRKRNSKGANPNQPNSNAYLSISAMLCVKNRGHDKRSDLSVFDYRCFNKRVIFENAEMHSAPPRNQPLAAGSFAGIFESSTAGDTITICLTQLCLLMPDVAACPETSIPHSPQLLDSTCHKFAALFAHKHMFLLHWTSVVLLETFVKFSLRDDFGGAKRKSCCHSLNRSGKWAVVG